MSRDRRLQALAKIWPAPPPVACPCNGFVTIWLGVDDPVPNGIAHCPDCGQPARRTIYLVPDSPPVTVEELLEVMP